MASTYCCTLLLLLALAFFIAEGAEVESIEQITDFPSWIAEALSLSPERGVYAFVRHYESTARAKPSECNRLKLSILDKRVDNLSIVLERQFQPQMDAAIRSASLLSTLFQTRKFSFTPEGDNVRITSNCGSLCDDAYYYTVARASVEADDRVLGFGFAFASRQYVRVEHSGGTNGKLVREFYPYAHRNATNRSHLLVMDVSRSLRYSSGEGQYGGTDWYNQLAPPSRNYSQLFRRTADVVVQNLGESSYRVEPRGVVFASREEARWTVPYFDCKVTYAWKATYSVPFFDAHENFKGVVTLDVALNDVDIDQCASASSFPLFGSTHKCKQETTDCVPLPGRGFRLGSYECRCRSGFYFKAAATPSNSNATSDTLPSTSSSSSFAAPTPLPAPSARRKRQASEDYPDLESVNEDGISSGDEVIEKDGSPTENSRAIAEEPDSFDNQREAFINVSSAYRPTVQEPANSATSTTKTELSGNEDLSMLEEMYLQIARANGDVLAKSGQIDVMARANAQANLFTGWLVEYAFSKRQYAFKGGKPDVADYDVTFQCLPCKVGCDSCVDDTPCLAESNMVLRGLPLAFQSFFVTICCLVAVLVFRLRRTKLMRSSTWLLQELILLGGVLIYFTIFVMYFEASLTTCMTQPWFRQIGFALVYGSILIRLYRILVEHQSRNARRVHLADRDMLKYVVAIVSITAGYMLIWTSVNVDQFSTAKLLQIGSDGVSKYLVCKAYWWDYLVELGELLFVSVCIYLCYCARACPADFGEVRLMTVAVCNEALLSGVFHLSRHFFWLKAHPDTLFLAYFVHCHLTVTVTLCLVVGSRVWFAHVQAATTACTRGSAGSAGALLQPSHATAARTGSSVLSPAGPSSNGELDNGDANLSEMDADEVRAELRRVYMQLQIYKHKAMRKDNPHIAKRGKATKCDRRSSNDPASGSKRGVASRTPEESTASNDRAGTD